MQDYSIKLSNKRRTISIIISKDLQVRILAPKSCSMSVIEAFVAKQQLWIAKKLHQLKEKLITAKNSYEYIWYLGQKYSLQISDNSKKNAIEFVENEAILYKKTKHNIEKCFKISIVELSKDIFNERLNLCYHIFNKIVPCSMPSLQIKFMKSRWGSMSSCSKKMCLNARLIYAKTEIIDYVIMHELSHIKHKNHGKNFYKLFIKLTPNLTELKQEIKLFYRQIGI